MRFPKEVDFKFMDKNEAPIPSLIVNFELPAASKNDYSLGRFLTSADGTIRLTKELINKRIEQAMFDYPMDYDCLLKDCKNSLNIIIETAHDIKAHIKNLAKYYSNEASNLHELLLRSINSKHSTQTIPVEINEKIRELVITVKD